MITMNKLKLGTHTRGMYAIDVQTDVKDITQLSQVKITRPYRILLKMKVNGKLSSKTFNFPTRKTLAKAIDQVNAERLALREKLETSGTLRNKRVNTVKRPVSFSEGWDDFYRVKSSKVRWATQVAYQTDYEQCMQELVSMKMTDINERTMETFIINLKKRGYADSRIIRVLASVKQVLKRNDQHINWKSDDLNDTLKSLKPNRRRYELSLDQSKQLVIAMKSYYHSTVRDIFVWLLHGRRIGEVLNLRKDWISRERNVYVIPAEHSKSKRELTLPMDDELWECMDRIPESVLNTRCYTLSNTIIRRHFNKLTDELKLPRMHLHDIRHLIGTMLYQNGVPIQDIAVVLGHSDVQTTIACYVNDSHTQAQSALSSFDKLMS